MKSEILSLLRDRRDYVSGQELCGRFGVSRTAVWKAIGQLKKEGYHIEAVRNRGYLLEEETELFGRDELESRIRTRWAGRPVTWYERLDSTNLRAKLDAENGAPHGALIVADMQTAGRGRRGRGWVSVPGTNVYFTIILKPDLPPGKASMLTPVMGMAVARGINECCGIMPEIKWPNDVVINGKKVCGILAEMSLERDYIHYIVIGVGINVGLQEFPDEIADKACCLQGESGRRVNRAELIAGVMSSFEEYYENFMKAGDLSGLREEYDGMLVNRGREVRVLDPAGEYNGIARGINDEGELLVECGDGSVTAVSAGEVSVRGILGYV